MDNTKYILNPDYIIRDDYNRFCLYNKGVMQNNAVPIYTFLHPLQARFFSFFTKEPQKLDDIISLISEDFDYTKDEVLKMVIPFIENEEIKILKLNDNNIYIPRNFLIQLEKVKGKYQPLHLKVPKESIYKAVDLKIRRLNVAPSSVTFMLTNQCCTHCCYCYADTTTTVSQHVPLGRLIEIVKEARKLNLSNINLIGGEVFLYKNWFHVLRSLVENDFMPDILSTKVPITENIATKIIDSGFTNLLQLSIDSLEPEKLSKTLNVNSHYARLLKKGIEILEEKHIPYQVGTVLTKWTASEENLKEIFTFFSTKHYIRNWEIRPAMYSIKKSESNFTDLKVSKNRFEELYSFIEQNLQPDSPLLITISKDVINKDYRKSEKGCESFAGAKCSALNNHFFILPDGKVTICEQLYWNPNFIIGDINHSSIEEIWQSPKAMSLVNMKRQEINKNSACRTCAFYDMCFRVDRNRCWSDIIKTYGENNWDYPDPRCSKAPVMLHDISYD